MDKIKISAVSYLNTKPFIFGIRNSALFPSVTLTLDNPSDCAQKLMNGESDIGLVPSGVLKSLHTSKIIPGFCIGATGKVGSVLLLSEVPLNKIETILLDYQSKTSVKLVKIISADHWKISPGFSEASPGYEHEINGSVAGVVIGDRALQLKHRFNYVYDLSLAWYEHTGLPFVFACWVSNGRADEEFISSFVNALAVGVQSIDEMLQSESQITKDFPGAENYLKNQVEYILDNEKRKGLDLFLSMI